MKKSIKNNNLLNIDFLNEIENELKENTVLNDDKKEKQVLKNKKDKLSKKEKQLLKDLILKFKNSELKEKQVLIKKIDFWNDDIKKLNELLNKYLKDRKKKKSFSEYKNTRLFKFWNDDKKNLDLLYFQNWKINKKYLQNLENENEKILFSEYVKIQNIWKYEKDIIKDIEYENMKFWKTLQFINSFNNEMKKKNSKDIKILNSYFLKSNISKNIKNSKLIKIENENENNIFWRKWWYFENEFINKINNKYIIEILKNDINFKLKIEKIIKYLNELDIISSEYNCKSKSKKDYINKNKIEIVNKWNRIIKNYIKKYWNDDKKINEIKKDILKTFEKQLNIIKILINKNEIDYKNYNLEYKNLQNKINYNSKDIKNKYEYLLSE